MTSAFANPSRVEATGNSILDRIISNVTSSNNSTNQPSATSSSRVKLNSPHLEPSAVLNNGLTHPSSISQVAANTLGGTTSSLNATSERLPVSYNNGQSFTTSSNQNLSDLMRVGERLQMSVESKAGEMDKIRRGSNASTVDLEAIMRQNNNLLRSLDHVMPVMNGSRDEINSKYVNLSQSVQSPNFTKNTSSASLAASARKPQD